MTWLAKLSYDAGEFKEELHPRDDDGKFSKGGGGGSGGKEHAIKPTKTIKVIMAKAGFKKMYSADPHEVKFQDKATGVKVTVHLKGAGQPTSGKWSLEDPSTGLKTGEGSSLAKLVGVIQVNGKFKNAQKHKEPEESLENKYFTDKLAASHPKITAKEYENLSQMLEDVKEVLVVKKFVFTGSDPSGIMHFSNLGIMEGISYNPITGVYTVYTPEGNYEGAGAAKLYDILSGKGVYWAKSNKPTPPQAAVTQAVAVQPTQEAAQQTISHSDNLGKLKSIIGPKNYTFDAGAKDVPYVYNYFSENGNSGVQFNTKTEEWIAKTEGFPTKEGVGLENLKKLMAGEKVSGSPPSWKNTGKTIVSSKAAVAEQEKTAKKNLSYETLDYLKSIAPKPTSAEEDAIGSYTASGFASLNDKLRLNPFKDDFEGAIGKAVKNLDSYFEKATIGKEVTLYRKVSGDHAKTMISSLIEDESVFWETGYVSTSTHKETWSGTLQYVITAPAGTKGAAVKEWSSHSGENEVMLPRRTKFKVGKIDYENKHIHLTVIGVHSNKKAK